MPSLHYRGIIGIVFALTCAVTWSTSVILFKKTSDELHPILINVFKNWLATLLMIPTLIIFSSAPLSTIASQDLLVLALSGILGIGIADALVLKSLKTIGASKIAIVECTYSPFVILIAILHLNESLNSLQSFGIAFVLGSILLISVQRRGDERKGQTSRKGIVLGILGIFSMALGITIVKPIFSRVELLPIVFIRLLAGSLASLVLCPVFKLPMRSIGQVFRVENKLTFFVACVLSTYVSMLFWVAGFKFNDVSIASVLNQTSTIFTVIFAAIFLRERLTGRVVVAALMAVSGVAMVALNS